MKFPTLMGSVGGWVFVEDVNRRNLSGALSVYSGAISGGFLWRIFTVALVGMPLRPFLAPCLNRTPQFFVAKHRVAFSII